MLDLYKNIKDARIRKGYTQDELAKKIGYSSKSMIARIEKGEIDLPQSKIVSFAKALETTPSELMGLGIDIDQGNNSISSNGSSRDITNTTTTNNFFSQKQSCGNSALTTADSKNYFFAIIDNLRGMDDSSLRDVLKYTQFILSKQEDEK